MPFNAYSNGLFATALIAVLLVPAPYYVTDFYDSKKISPVSTEEEDESNWLENFVKQVPSVDLFASILLVIVGFICFICEFIRRKLMEIKIKTLNETLSASVERLQTWDREQEQLEATLMMVQNATSEYNLLLYLLLRQHRRLQPQQTTNCFLEKDLDEDLNFLRNLDI